MTTENQQINKTTPSSLNSIDATGKMQGWFKLMEKIRKTGSQSNDSIRSLPNSNLNNNHIIDTLSQQQNSFEKSLPSINTNGHLLKSPETINTIDSPPNIFNSPSIISLESTPRQIIEDIPSVEIESASRLIRESIPLIELESSTTTAASSPASSDSKCSLTRSKKIIIRKANKSKPTSSSIQKPVEMSTPITEDISDDDVPLIDIRKHKTKSIDTLSIPSLRDSIIPLATDLQSLPGHCQDEIRDIRFLNYSDIDTLSMHFNICLYIDKRSLTKQYIYKTRYNVWNKILKLYYVKTFRKKLSTEKSINKNNNYKQQPLSVISSPTSISFKMDWNVNRRNISSSTHRHTPKNLFHVLQLNPKTQISLSDTSSSSSTTTKSPIQTFERIKDILARTYYPHFYKAIEYGYQFGTKSKYPNTQQLITTHSDIIDVKEMPESPNLLDASITITLKSPPTTKRGSNVIQQLPIVTTSTTNERKIKIFKMDDKSLSPKHNKCHMNENIDELSPWIIRKSVVVLTPAKIPLSSPSPSPSPPPLPLNEKEKNLHTTNRKRKSSTTTNTHIIERKKKRIVSSPSLEIINQIEDISNSESDEDLLPSELPKQCFIKNGLRSNYYKTTTNANSKPTSNKNRLERRRRQSSGSLPPFYTGIFESNDDKSSYIDYHLPYDIYWFGQQQQTKETTLNNSTSPLLSSSISTFQHTKKKSNKPKQKQPLPFKKISRNAYSDQLRQSLLSSYSIEKAPVCDCKPSGTCEDGVCLNRMIFTECLPDCACGVKCSNQKIRKSQWFKHLEVFDTSKYGQGLRTTVPIQKGTFLCEYVGEIITEEKFHERMANIYSKDEHHYTMKLTQNLVIDAYRMGSVARFANHSCSPNCEFQKWTVEGLQRMCMFSLRPIKAGEELTYDYNFQCFNLQAQQPCYCESLKCRGTIGTKQQSTLITTNNNTSITTIQKLTQREKRMILQSSIFLLRNLRRIKEKQELRKKNSNKLKQQIDKQSTISLFFAQNYYHSNPLYNKSTLASLRKTPKLAHKVKLNLIYLDIFYLFYNHIRRSHFAKSGRHYYELIDNTCYYAQLAQLTLILNEIFELISNYKCTNKDITPSVVLKKCPSKRLFPAYYEIITKPIDLTMIRTKLDNGEYLSFHIFEKDLLLLFKNAITYCGEDSDEAEAVLELQSYFHNTLKVEYKKILNLFLNMKDKERNLTNLQTLENFIGRLHEKEIIYGQIREILYDIIYNIDENSDNDSPIVYKIVLASNVNSHRTSRSRTSSDCIVHCRCGSVYDENSLVQCYACQFWQHVACVSIVDSSRPYYCFECRPACEHNPSACLKTNVIIAATLSPLQTYDDNHSSYSTLTRSDGFIIRINECYFVPKQDEKNIDRSLTSPEYDILFVERLWIDDYGIGQASGFYYIRPNETFHEPNRKFFPNEVFRFPSSNDPLPISSIVRPCFVLDIGTYCKGKPISDNSSRVLSSDLFICEYRVDKSARTFTRLLKSRHYGINTKSYCFDNYVERLSIKRDYQPYQKELQQQQQQQQQHHHHSHENRRRLTVNLNKLTNRQFEEKSTRINGIIEKIYCRYHDQNLIPNDTKYTVDELLQCSPTSSILADRNNHHDNSCLRNKLSSVSLSSIASPLQTPAENINKKRRTISLSSDDDIVELIPENNCQRTSKKRSTKQTTMNSHKRDESIDQV
ncbi:unnamed protein product [Rotaria sordida]|uniref:Histone-lysine N-methyltransferase n=1 Tax=Rotaria sordida TaxID=392033 RepID=A0A814JL45_9BILA|nr:unnamed protein product [Rotaria sordida]CAF3780731.1 unnamed protein product [Rotaria sordida]